MAIEVKYIGGSMDGKTRRTRSLCDLNRVQRFIWREFDKATNKPTGNERRESYRLDFPSRQYVLQGDIESETLHSNILAERIAAFTA